VSGNIVVGDADTAGGADHAFAYDLGAAHPAMIDLGTLSGDASDDTHAVSGNIVVGYSYPASVLDAHAFAYDLGAAHPAMIDLGTLSGDIGSQAYAVSGNIVAGDSITASGTDQAVAWTLHRHGHSGAG
jgi:probable HAF family extracellular repeat protein